MSTTQSKHSASNNHNQKIDGKRNVRITIPKSIAGEKPAVAEEKKVATYKVSAKIKEKAEYNCYMKRTNLAAQVEKFVALLAESKQNVLE